MGSADLPLVPSAGVKAVRHVHLPDSTADISDHNASSTSNTGPPAGKADMYLEEAIVYRTPVHVIRTLILCYYERSLGQVLVALQPANDLAAPS